MRIPDFKRHSRLLLDVGLLIALRISAITVGLVYVKVYTSRLTTNDLGIFFYLTTLSYLINALLFVPYDYYIQAYCSRAGEHLPWRPVARMTGGVLTAALLLALAAGSLLIVLGQLTVSDVALLYGMAVLLFVCTSLRNLLNNRGHRRIAAAALLIEAVGRISAFLLLLFAFTPSGRVLFGSAAAALVVELLVLTGFAASKLSWTGDSTLPRSSIVATTAPVSISAACNLLQLQGYRTMYPWSGIPTTAALFAVVANIGAAGMMAAGQVFSQIFLPRVYQSGGEFIGTYVKLATVLIMAVAAFAWIVSPWLVPFMTSPLYGRYAGLIVFGVVMEGSNLIVAAIAARSMLQGDTRHLMTWNIASAVVGAGGYGLSIVFAPDSPMAIGIALLLSQTVVVGGLMMSLRRNPPIQTASSHPTVEILP